MSTISTIPTLDKELPLSGLICRPCYEGLVAGPEETAPQHTWSELLVAAPPGAFISCLVCSVCGVRTLAPLAFYSLEAIPGRLAILQGVVTG